jgi:hypothetical protein
MIQPAADPIDQQRGADFQNHTAELTQFMAHGRHSSWDWAGTSSAFS